MLHRRTLVEKQSISMIFWSIQIKLLAAFLNLECVLSMLLYFEHFSALRSSERSYKKGS